MTPSAQQHVIVRGAQKRRSRCSASPAVRRLKIKFAQAWRRSSFRSCCSFYEEARQTQKAGRIRHQHVYPVAAVYINAQLAGCIEKLCQTKPLLRRHLFMRVGCALKARLSILMLQMVITPAPPPTTPPKSKYALKRSANHGR